MTRSTMLFIAGVLLICAAACEKDAHTAEAPPVPVKLTLEERLNLLSPPLVLFQYFYVDFSKGEESGWIVDRHGNVKSYQRKLGDEGSAMAAKLKLEESALLDLYARATEPLATIGLEELLERAHQGAGLSHKFLTATEIHDEKSWVTGFYAFTQPYRASTHGYTGRGCYGPADYIDSSSGATPTPITRHIINVSGHFNRHETSAYALDLHQWLDDLKNELL